MLAKAFPLMWIQGEISNLAIPSSGHWYFTLKDDKAQVRAAMFKPRNRHLSLRPQNGMEVMVRAQVSLYEPRGDYQLIVEDMEEAGAGALQREFERLKARLQAEGLFELSAKQALPAHPQTIGVITSPTGAAIRDILSVLQRRAPHVSVVIYPVPVQGEGAAQKIASMLAKANSRGECDVLILTRGGGSLEDLWPFNEEIVARAVYSSAIPVISGVGHEIDFTIADFVADQRAPTPSAAAELAVPEQQALRQLVEQLDRRNRMLTHNRIGQLTKELKWLSARLKHPSQTLEEKAQKTDELELRLAQALQRSLKQKGLIVLSRQAQLQQHNPRAQFMRHSQRFETSAEQLRRTMKQILHNQHTALGKLAHSLDTISPLATLQRGYAIITRDDNQQLVQHIDTAPTGTRIKARLGHGTLIAKVEETQLE